MSRVISLMRIALCILTVACLCPAVRAQSPPVEFSATVSPANLPNSGGTAMISGTVSFDDTRVNIGLQNYTLLATDGAGHSTDCHSVQVSQTGNYSNYTLSGQIPLPANATGNPFSYGFKMYVSYYDNNNNPIVDSFFITGTVTVAGSAPTLTASVAPPTLPVAGGTITVSATADDGGTGLNYYPLAEVYKDGADTGQSFYLSTTGDYSTGGNFTGTYPLATNYDTSSHTYTFVVSATDNIGTTTVTATGSTVQAEDTVPPSITATNVSPATLPVTGGTVTVKATVTDNGSNSIGLNYYPMVEIYKDNADTGQVFYLTTGNYQTGGMFSGTTTFGTNYSNSAHTYTFKITATDQRTMPLSTTVQATGSTVQANDTTAPSIMGATASPSTLPVAGGMVTVMATVADSGSNNTGLSYYPMVEIFKDGIDTGQVFYLDTTGNYQTGGAFSGQYTLPENYDTASHTFTFKVTATDQVTPTPNSTTVTATGSTVQSGDTVPPSITATSVSPSALPVTGGTVTVKATVNDSGNNSTGLGYYPIVEIYKDGTDTGQSFYLTTGNYQTGGMFSGTFTFGINYSNSAHTYTFKVTATDQGQPTPLSTTATVMGSMTQAGDTTPPSITATSVMPSTLPVTGGTVTVKATVTDSGSSNTGLSYYPMVEIFKDGVDTGESFYLTTGNYQTGGMFSGTFTFGVNDSTGAHTYTFKVTASDQVQPTPNMTIVTVSSTVQANDTMAPSITATSVSPATLPAAGGIVTVKATVTDSGSSNTGLSYYPMVEVYKNGTDTGQSFYLSTTGNYQTGGAFTGTFTAPANSDPDYDKYTFVISASDNVTPTPHTTTVTATGSCLVASSANQPVPTLTAISPASGHQNTAVTLTLTGTNFGYRSTVMFGTLAIAPSTVSATQLTAQVPASALSTLGTVNVTVVNSGPGGGTSAAKTFTVTNPPSITSFTPASGPVGTTVVITGMSLTGTSVVGFQNAHAATFTVNGMGTQITTTVPAGAQTGLIAVLTPGGEAKSAADFTVTTPPPAPLITSFSPTSGPAGTTVVITGMNLTGATVVGFQNAHATSFTVNGAGTQITATVPSGAVTGKIAVLTPGGEAKSATNFTVTAAPMKATITSFTPASGPVGMTVVITGTNLTGTTVVGFQGQHAKSFAVNGTGTQITTTVPAGAVPGPIAVLTPGGEAKSATSFTVTP